MVAEVNNLLKGGCTPSYSPRHGERDGLCPHILLMPLETGSSPHRGSLCSRQNVSKTWFSLSKVSPFLVLSLGTWHPLALKRADAWVLPQASKIRTAGRTEAGVVPRNFLSNGHKNHCYRYLLMVPLGYKSAEHSYLLLITSPPCALGYSFLYHLHNQ